MSDFLNPANLSGVAFEVLLKCLFVLAFIKALEHVAIKNRKITPALIWLLVIPGFNILWNFYVAIRFSESLKKELDDREFEVKGQPTLILGLAYAVLSACSLFLPAVAMPTNTASPSPEEIKNILPYSILGLAWIIMFIQYWMKINWYKSVLKNDAEEANSTE